MLQWLYRLVCRHQFRASTTWPGMIVCRKCGLRRIVE